MPGHVFGAQAREFREEFRRAVRVEDGDRPGEPGRSGPEFLQAADEATAAGARAEVAEQAGRSGDGFEHPVAGLGEQLDRLVRVAGGHGPQLLAERLVRVSAERVAGQCRGGLGGEGVQAQGEDGAVAERGEGGGRARFARFRRQGAVGEDDEGGQASVAPDPGEGVEPGQGFGVGPVRVVHEEHERPVPQPFREALQEPGESEEYALRVGGCGRGRGCEPERGGEEVEVFAEEVVDVLGAEGVEGGLEELPGEVEGDRGEGLAAAGGQDGAPVLGGSAYLGEERGLPDAGLSAVDEDAALGGSARRGSGHELVDGVGRRGEFRAAFEQGALVLGDGGRRVSLTGMRLRRPCRWRLFRFRRHRSHSPTRATALT